VNAIDTHALDDSPERLGDLAPGEAQAHARDAWRRSGGRLTGAELARRYGRSERWGRQQIAAARAQQPGTTPASGNGTSGTTAVPPRRPPAPAGTPGTVSPAAALPPTSGAARPAHPTGTGTRPAPNWRQGRQAAGVPLPLLGVTVAAVGVVTLVCAVVSYSHIRDLARVAGMGSLASWLPLGIDGLVVAASCSLIVDRQLGRPGHALAWAGVALGLAGSLAANVLKVDPELVSLRAVRWALAGYRPAALAVSGHLLFRMLGDR
jgi:Protein of unknown function (DUF2637)